MRRKYGPLWRQRIGEGHGRLGLHAVTTAAGLAAIAWGAAGRNRAATLAAGTWAGLTAEFATRRILPGPRTRGEIGRMVLTSLLIPPIACWHRLHGEIRHRRDSPLGPQALLFDRDDTLIIDVPYLADPALVRPVPGAADSLRKLRAAGVHVGVVSNQSGVARGLISGEQLTAVNSRVEQLLGPFGTWQVCVHGDGDGCACRKPAPGLVRQAAKDLGVDVRRCVVIGDTGADIEAATAAGARGILVPTEKTRPAEIVRAQRDATVARNLVDAVRLAMTGTR
jgi:histidinol-phosphate phosphatase family protein